MTYKEIFPLIKDQEIWPGYMFNKTCIFRLADSYEKYDKKITAEMHDGHKYGKVPAIAVFTNLDIKKRHEELILWKAYTPGEYPHYDNYDAINVDKVAEIPKDYCESWELTLDEYNRLPKDEWEVVRHGFREEDTVFVIPAAGTALRKLLHDHSDGYKEQIEKELGNALYDPGVMGVPITFLDKYNPEQFDIIKFRKGDDEKDLTYSANKQNAPTDRQTDRQTDNCSVLQNTCQEDIVTESSECQLHSSTSIVRNSSFSGEQQNQRELASVADYGIQLPKSRSRSYIPCANINVFLQERYCNGVMGVPITFLDKYSPEQFIIYGLDRYVPDNPKYGHRFTISGKETYARILIKRVWG